MDNRIAQWVRVGQLRSGASWFRREFVAPFARLRQLLPDLGDLSAFAGVALLTHVLWSLSWMAGQSFLGALLLLVALVRMGVLTRRPKGDD